MHPATRAQVERLRQLTGHRLALKEWESITKLMTDDSTVLVVVETYEVKELVREDRYLRKGSRWVSFTQASGRWYVDSDMTAWDESFVTYIFDKTGRRPTVEESAEQREWEQLCYRPGSAATPLDSYERVCDPLVRSTKKMEGHY